MRTYFIPIEVASLLLPLLALVLTLPYMIYNYRKYGSISPLRTVILFSLVFYLECAYFLTILPLPDPAEVAKYTGRFYQLIPLTFIGDFIRESGFNIHQPSTWLAALRSSTVYQPLSNLFLTVPWGIYLCYYFKKSLRRVTLLSFSLSLFFELTQLSGLYGLYPRPYRMFDVDDLLLNTLGGVVGYWLATHVLRILPTRDAIDKKSRERGVNVSFTRRTIAALVDLLFIDFVQIICGLLLGYLGFSVNGTIVFIMVLLLYSMAIPILCHGATLGKALVKIRVRGLDAGASPARLLVLRYLLRNIVILVFLGSLMIAAAFDYPYQLIAVIIQFVVILFAFIDFLWSLRKQKRLFYERVSKTLSISTHNLVKGSQGS